MLSGEPGRTERLPGNRAAVIRNLNCLVPHGLADPLQKLLFTSDDGDWPVSETIQRLNALFLLQHAPKTDRKSVAQGPLPLCPPRPPRPPPKPPLSSRRGRLPGIRDHPTAECVVFVAACSKT